MGDIQRVEGITIDVSNFVTVEGCVMQSMSGDGSTAMSSGMAVTVQQVQFDHVE